MACVTAKILECRSGFCYIYSCGTQKFWLVYCPINHLVRIIKDNAAVQTLCLVYLDLHETFNIDWVHNFLNIDL